MHSYYPKAKSRWFTYTILTWHSSKQVIYGLVLLLLIFSIFINSSTVCEAASSPAARIAGTVVDTMGAVIPNADVVLLNEHNSVLQRARSDGQGRFVCENVPPGSYVVEVARHDFATQRVPARIASASGQLDLQITLRPGTILSEITVTAARGEVQAETETPQVINIADVQDLGRRAYNVLPQLLSEEVGLHVQQTTPHQGAVFIRGLTGQQVVTLIDGIRFNTSTFRPGPNQYQALLDPTGVERIEVVHGPSSAQYGSDSLGGTVNVISQPVLISSGRFEVHGQMSTLFQSADLSGGAHVKSVFGTDRIGLMVGGFGQRTQDVRAGGGRDSHAAVVRFLGLPSDILGHRLQDTAFTQYGGFARFAFKPSTDQHITLSYNRSDQRGGRRYDQLNGGNGNLINGFNPQTLDFFYARYEKQAVGFLDALALTFSFNRQRDDRQTQGGSGNPLAPITYEFNRTDAYGYQAQGLTHIGRRQFLTFGGELYDEHITSRLTRLNPATQQFTGSLRARFPDGAHYQTYGAFIQDTANVLPHRLRLTGGIRYSAFFFKAFAKDNPLGSGGVPTVLDTSLRTDDVTFNLGASVFVTPRLTLSAIASRGFRAPNVTDLSSIGLTSNGFEVSTDEGIARGGQIGTTADATAQSSGQRVSAIDPESLYNYEFTAKYQHDRARVTFSFFDAEISDFISKRALILPPGAVGQTIGGQPIVFQDSRGWVRVPVDNRPVILRVNAGDVRIYGLEAATEFRLSTAWTISGNFFYLRGRDKHAAPLPPPTPGAISIRTAPDAPEIEGGLPPATGFLSLRYDQPGRRYWIEAYSHLVSYQDRLSSIELADQRIGATRSRSSIAAFFNNGARARGLTGPGPDGAFATVDDVLLATGATLAQVQDRVLGSGITSAPLFLKTPGYGTVNLRGGYRLGERSEIVVILENILDKNYRTHGSGIDAPGINVLVRYLIRF
ncbi:MAG: TonB-dependent receptor [Acidobacteria bacterium]|nr:TonB-dependent receptor [Acidobacteriota bacterium]